MTKVRQETIDRISKMGMSRALKEAQNGDAELQEGVRRYYPHAKFGPKSAAQATKDEGTQQRAANKDDAIVNQQRSAASPTPVGKPAPQAASPQVAPKPIPASPAVTRRVEPPKKNKSVGGITSIAGVKDPLGYKHGGPRTNLHATYNRVTNPQDPFGTKHDGPRQDFGRGLGIIGNKIGGLFKGDDNSAGAVAKRKKAMDNKKTIKLK